MVLKASFSDKGLQSYFDVIPQDHRFWIFYWFVGYHLITDTEPHYKSTFFFPHRKTFTLREY